ncbi:MAG TPA: HEAT repeat domain-containing protein, partial [Thermoanaerobaculia bacterium]|nr:HEAT repeat domain-containing protein [Thermoanaerobaculia bacterium]
DSIKNLALDKERGQAREMLAFALAKMKNPQAADVLIGLLADEVMVGHAIAALGKLRERRARTLIEQHLDHPKAWIRKEAKRAMAKIDKTSQE